MRGLATLLASLAMALTALGLAVANPGGPEPAPRAALASASGALSISNSRDGEAVFSAVAMRPGEAVIGTVRIGNMGSLPGRFSVRSASMLDVPGPQGGRLSERVTLVVYDVTDAHRPVTVYTGPLAGFGAVELGTWPADARRDYRVTATFPNGGASGADNRFQGSTLSLGLDWRAFTTLTEPPPPTPTPPLPPPTPTPTPDTRGTPDTPGPPATPATPASPGTPAPPPAPAALSGEALADALGLPPASRCIGRRRLSIRLRAPSRARVRSATVKVTGKRALHVRGGRTEVTVRGLRGRRVTVRITVRASDGRTYRTSRRYRTCR